MICHRGEQAGHSQPQYLKGYNGGYLGVRLRSRSSAARSFEMAFRAARSMARYRRITDAPNSVSVAEPPPLPPVAVLTTGCLNCEFMLSTSSQADRYDMRISRAALLIDPPSRIDSRILIFPGPS